MSQAPQEFVSLIASVTEFVKNRPIDSTLADDLNERFPGDSYAFGAIEKLCRIGVAEGWLCTHESDGIKFGRVIKAGEATHGFSVDVVEMDDMAGLHHAHPNGEIDMVMPIDDGAEFDGTPRGWKVYEPGSTHYPTVTGGKALVLYLLPDGAIEFTRS